MKFPITRESLQAFDYLTEQKEKLEEEIQKSFTQMVDIICREFQQTMQSNSTEKRFVWRNLHLVRNLHINVRFPVGSTCNTMNIDAYLPRFIEKLKETFIGCDIIIDPLKTYLIIDWS
jgi:hypothetical protein